ncbi:hypothetical protein, partial [Streptomyces sp. C1-2]|uniref:hypothetical protein n=1 Tax=Streptomyces sp. C1-2 TaxID=2720022 RepID=UPI00143268E7
MPEKYVDDPKHYIWHYRRFRRALDAQEDPQEEEGASSVAVHPDDDPGWLGDSHVQDPLAGGVEAYRETLKRAQKGEAGSVIAQNEHARVFSGFLKNADGSPLQQGISLRRKYLSRRRIFGSSSRDALNGEIQKEITLIEAELRKREASASSQKMIPGERERRLLQALRSSGYDEQLPSGDRRVYAALRERSVDWAGLHDIPAMSLILVERRGLQVEDREYVAAGNRLKGFPWFEPYR